ncbi:bacteriophage spanin2 family protein [Actinokineospora sp. PR83]|uniref:bacteriophage spanin2 family protein n=1 Tax=Actinokineospora sp. PR83 TaxID=2884908 RepID=UPI001F34074D|nr:bacteriophage spanin2 family protein [Actinokineospora sp. PR83]MCG8915626.1 bacteriophage spanin2 family protein [Actinokineospora sp. PR83]
MRTSLIAVAVAGSLALLTGCSGLQDAADTAAAASQTLSSAQVCLDAVGAVDFVPDVLNPQNTVEQSRTAAETLNDLAGKAADTTVNDAIRDLSDTLAAVTLDDLASPVVWVQRKTDQAAALLQACSMQ